MTADDYVLGKIQRNNVWSLAKYRLSSFLSKVTGNSISWNGGFFFNFTAAIKGILDKKGGVVAKDTYDSDMQTLNTSIQNVGKENQNIIKNAQDALDKAVAPDQFYATKSPALETGGKPTDAAKGDALLTILSKFQRYITRFKYATGIRVSTDFTDAVNPEYVNNNDTVDSALRKIQYWLKHAGTGSKLSPDWAPKDYAGSIVDVAGGDSLDEAFAKAIGKLNQIGDISNGLVQSKATVNGSTYTRRTQLNLGNGSLTFNRDATSPGSQQNVTLSKDSGLYMNNSAGKALRASAEGIRLDALTNQGFQLPSYEDYWGWGTIYGAAAALFVGQGTQLGGYTSVGIAAAISALCTKGSLSGVDVFDAYFAKLKGGSISYGRANMQQTDLYLANDCSFVTCTNTENRNLFLPSSPLDGQMIIVNQVNSANVAVQGNGRKIVDNEDVDYVNVGGARRVAIFLYHGSLSSSAGSGAWLFFRWAR